MGVSQILTLFGPITLTVYSYTLRKTDTFLFYNQAKLWQKQSLPAARDAREFSKLGAGENMEEIRNRCGAFANTGSPHHLCLHLCYYREYDPARRLFVLRTRLAAALGSASLLDNWRASLRAATSTEMGIASSDDEAFDDGDPDELEDDDSEDDLQSPEGTPVVSPVRTPRKSPAKGKGKAKAKPTGKTRKRKRKQHDATGWLSGASLPWRVVFTSPDGFSFENGAEVLAVCGVCQANAPQAAATGAGGGGLGVETNEDFEGFAPDGSTLDDDANANTESARRDPIGARATGRVQPPRRQRALNLGTGGSHGGSGVRLARPDERGLDAATDVLRAALWPARSDAVVGTSPVRERLARFKTGAPRSPTRVAPDYDGNTYSMTTRTTELVTERSSFGSRQVTEETEEAGSPDCSTQTKRWSPPRSPFGLLEEILFASEWRVLVGCMMLNCTTRLLVDRVLWRLFLLAPSAVDAVRVGRGATWTTAQGGVGESLAVALPAGSDTDPDGYSIDGMRVLESILAPLGLHRKRARAFVRLSEDYLAAQSRDGTGNASRTLPQQISRITTPVSSLHGVGAYAADAHALFCEGILGVAPRDHALRWWYAWAIERREGERREQAERRRGETGQDAF